MVQSFIIRRARPDDNEPVRAMIFSVLDEFGVPSEPEGDDRDASEFGLNDDRIYLVAELSGKAIGSAILTASGPNTFKLSKLFLGKEFRHLGIGRRLLEASVIEAKNAGADTIYLRTRDSYADAIRLYERCGWTRHSDALPPPGPPIKYSLHITQNRER